MEWKKMKFMEQHIGEEFDGLIVSVTKFGMFVELNDMFIEGLVPLASLIDDRYQYHENTRQIIGAAQPQDLLHGRSHSRAGRPPRPNAASHPVRRGRRATHSRQAKVQEVNSAVRPVT